MNMKNAFKQLFVILALSLLPGATAFSEETTASPEKVIFHVDDTKNARWALMLANTYLEDSPDARIVFVTYGPGIDFLLTGSKDRKGNSYASALNNLADKGVAFRLCEKTLEFREIPKDKVWDGVEIVADGIKEIVRLQSSEGFAYLKP
jgi:hypothetical protein